MESSPTDLIATAGAAGALASVATVFITRAFTFATIRRTQNVNLSQVFQEMLIERMKAMDIEIQRLNDLLRRSGEECDERVRRVEEDYGERLRVLEERTRGDWKGEERRRKRVGINGEPWGLPDVEDSNGN